MRVLVSILLACLTMTAIAGTAFADDKDLIDTQNGLAFTKPPGWVQAEAKKGTLSKLEAADDKSAQIEVRFAGVTTDKAGQYFTTFHSSLVKARLKATGPGESKLYGKLNGKLTEYKAGEGDKAKQLLVFEFTTDKGAWLVVGMFPSAKRDAYLSGFEALLASVVEK